MGPTALFRLVRVITPNIIPRRMPTWCFGSDREICTRLLCVFAKASPDFDFVSFLTGFSLVKRFRRIRITLAQFRSANKAEKYKTPRARLRDGHVKNVCNVSRSTFPKRPGNLDFWP